MTLYVSGFVDGQPFERECDIKSVPNILVQDVTGVQVDGGDFNYVNILCKMYKREDLKVDSGVARWFGDHAKVIWGFILKRKSHLVKYGILINPTEPAVSRKFVAYDVHEINDFDGSALVLNVVYEMNYPHPDAPEQAVHPKVEVHELMRVSKGQMLYNAVYMVFAAQEALNQALTANGTHV